MKLVERSVTGFLDELGSDSPAPGGGSAAALAGAIAAALCEMVCRLTLGREKLRVSWEAMEQARASAARLGARLRALVDEDAAAYNTVAAARRLPRETEAEKSERRRAVQDATIRAARTPLETLGALADLALVVERVVSEGNPACVSDAGSAGALVRAGALAAGYNVRINLPSVEDATIRRELSAETEKALKAVSMAAGRIEQILETRLNERSAP